MFQSKRVKDSPVAPNLAVAIHGPLGVSPTDFRFPSRMTRLGKGWLKEAANEPLWMILPGSTSLSQPASTRPDLVCRLYSALTRARSPEQAYEQLLNFDLIAGSSES